MEALFRATFTNELRDVAARASQLAVHYHHDQIDLAHFVLALIESPNKALGRISEETDRGFRDTRKRVRTYLVTLPRQEMKELSVEDLTPTSRLKDILRQAQQQATRRGVKRISAEHLFVALATEDFYSEAERGAVGARLLSPMQMTPSQVERILFAPPKDGKIEDSNWPML